VMVTFFFIAEILKRLNLLEWGMHTNRTKVIGYPGVRDESSIGARAAFHPKR
jgi:hypothetical protein